MRTVAIVAVTAVIGLAAGAAVGRDAQTQHPAQAQLPPPPYGTGMQPGMMGMMPPMMMEAMFGGSIAIGSDGTVYVSRAGTIYRYSRELKLINHTALIPSAPSASNAR